METMVAIRNRCSLKVHLSPHAVEPERIRKVLDAACMAPSARNSQPWRFVVVQGKLAVEALVNTAFFEFNRVVRQAPAIIIVCARVADDDVHEGREYYLFDVGLAVENMLLAATDIGLVTHLMTAFDEAAIRQILEIPEDYRVVVATPLAYPLEGTYDAAARERLGQRSRKALKEVAYFNKWGEREPG
jgi:nitroreductase